MIAPVEINPEDVCLHCKMAVSEKQYAAQFITKDGEAHKFDEIGCMREYLKTKQERGQVAAHFVADYKSGKWLKAEEAHFVKSAELATPMSGNIVAFQTPAEAQAAATNYQGEPLSFADVFGK